MQSYSFHTVLLVGNCSKSCYLYWLIKGGLTKECGILISPHFVLIKNAELKVLQLTIKYTHSIKTHFKCGESFAKTLRRVCAIFGQQNASNASTVQRLIEKFERIEAVVNIKKTPICRRSRQSTETIAVGLQV